MLTELRLRNLKPRQKTYIMTDGRGLYIEVLPTGGVIWRYRYSIGGKQEKLTLGRYPDMTLAMARTARDSSAHEVAAGRSPAREKQLAKKALAASTTVSQFIVCYYREVVGKARKRPEHVKRYLDYIDTTIGHKLMRDIDVADARALIWKKKDHGHDAAAGQVRGTLKRLFDYAITLGVASTNPVRALPMRHVHLARARDRVLGEKEIAAFIRALYASNIRRQFKIALHLLLITLVRKGELIGARWEHVDLDKKVWEIPADSMKMGKPHVVYLSQQAVDLFLDLKSLASESDFVLPGRSSLQKPFAHNAINSALKVALQGTNTPAFTIHDLRRTASTRLHEQGFASDVIEKALAHEIGGVRGVYNKAEYAEERKRMLQWWADHIQRLVTANVVPLGRVA